MKFVNRYLGLLFGTLFAFAGCAELTNNGGWLGGLGADISGQIVSHDSQHNVIEVATSGGGRSTFVYDQSTRFDYRSGSQDTPPAPGDNVSVTLRNQNDSQGRPFASTVVVRRANGGGIFGSNISGQIVSHDSQYNVIEVATSGGGRSTFVYDQSTRFTYRSSQGRPPTPGDNVSATLRNQRDSQGRPFANTVTVR
jgi:hypothetical protein